ncbi:MAG: type IV toxin-antitoxin system AbiEi family antitoxin domain-containing protein [Candidatus Accumulibacter sp.]|nr:type IV toxin-antitoxin system AbiEi family antitoxin domain-containing protein [Accumulibacter sp.]
MGEQNQSKLNLLLNELGHGELVSARWLRAHGYASSLVARYVRSGWLHSPARGVYSARNVSLTWEGVVASLQRREALRVHVGGRYALEWFGHEHYLRLGAAAAVTLYGPKRMPGWVTKLPLHERLVYCGKGPFAPSTVDAAAVDNNLYAHGLSRETVSSNVDEVVFSTSERAMLEFCDDRPSPALVYEADALMQGLTGLRPDLVGQLLRICTSVKAKRLFLALAERHQHAWLKRVELADVDLGSGKRVLVPGGRLNAKYLITLPADLGEQLG